MGAWTNLCETIEYNTFYPPHLFFPFLYNLCLVFVCSPMSLLIFALVFSLFFLFKLLSNENALIIYEHKLKINSTPHTAPTQAQFNYVAYISYCNSGANLWAMPPGSNLTKPNRNRDPNSDPIPNPNPAENPTESYWSEPTSQAAPPVMPN